MGAENYNRTATNQSETLQPTYRKSLHHDVVLLNRNSESASDYIRKVAENGTYASVNTYYVPLPHKLYRCLGLTTYEKMILIDLIAYMGTNSYCYPTQETIALNIGASSKTVSDHLWELRKKDFIGVDYRNHNNLYYLTPNLQDNPFIVLSELTYQFIREKRNYENVNEKALLASIKKFVDGERYVECAKGIQQTYMSSAELSDYSEESSKVKEIIKRFKQHLETLVY
jgi:biotin operon repressor